MMKNIVLVGFMGTGKSAVGKRVAQALGMRFINTDEMIANKAGMAINDIFSNKGEAHFRELEKDVISEVSRGEGALVDAGGGAVIDEDNVRNLKRNGIVICLNASPEEIHKRTKGRSHRPLLNVDDPLGKIKELLAGRSKYYKRADHQVETTGKTLDEVVQEVLQIYDTQGL